eukprot:Phypoly_transcript_13057.p1 GENE.Phypoly_transcript_13057~~Phypoly_transcript_13057.p1  ORF type:complete len:324 (+),score=83.49 Phypoly_transcript_13057:61-972(+)
MTMTPSSALHSRTLALLLKGWLEKHNKSIKFNYLVELVRSLRYLVQRASIMHSQDDLTAMVLINAERYIAVAGLPLTQEQTLHSILFTSFAITAKFWEDDRLFNSHIAPACGMRLEHLNKMEVLFLTTLKFEVTVTTDQVAEFFNDAKNRWDGRASVTSPTPSSASFSVSRLVSSFLHPTKPLASLPTAPSKPSLAQRTLSSPALKTTVSARPTLATRTVSTPNFATATPLTTPSTPLPTTSSSPITTATPLLTRPPSPSALTTSHTFTKPQRSSSAKELTGAKRLERASSKILSFFQRARDE